MAPKRVAGAAFGAAATTTTAVNKRQTVVLIDENAVDSWSTTATKQPELKRNITAPVRGYARPYGPPPTPKQFSHSLPVASGKKRVAFVSEKTSSDHAKENGQTKIPKSDAVKQLTKLYKLDTSKVMPVVAYRYNQTSELLSRRRQYEVIILTDAEWTTLTAAPETIESYMFAFHYEKESLLVGLGFLRRAKALACVQRVPFCSPRESADVLKSLATLGSDATAMTPQQTRDAYLQLQRTTRLKYPIGYAISIGLCHASP